MKFAEESTIKRAAAHNNKFAGNELLRPRGTLHSAGGFCFAAEFAAEKEVQPNRSKPTWPSWTR